MTELLSIADLKAGYGPVEVLHALPFGHELVLGRPVMDEHHVGIPAPSDIQRLAGADGNDLHADTLRLREQRQQMTEQPRLLRRGGRGHGDGAILCERDGGPEQSRSDRGKLPHAPSPTRQ